MRAENSAQKKFSIQALIYVCGSIAKNYIKSSRPCQSRRWEKKLWLNRLKIQRILLLSIQRSIAGSWKIWKMFQKINGEFVDRGHDPIEKKTILTITAINKSWPREIVKYFVNVRFFSKLKKFNLSFKENVKKCQNIKTNCSVNVLELWCDKI